MKKRRFLSLIVAMLMVMSSCLPVLADSKNGLEYDGSNIVTSSGTVTIDNISSSAVREDPSNPGQTIAGVNFTTYQIIYATYNPDDNTITYVLPTWVETALVGVGKLFSTTDEAIKAIQDSIDISTNDPTTGTSETEQTAVLNALAAYIVDVAGTSNEVTPYTTTFEYQQASYTATATLPVGVYLVIPSAENMAFLNMMVSVNAGRSTATNPQDNQWTITTVGATLKGNEVGINKYVEDYDSSQSTGAATTTTAEVQVGDTVTYTLKFDVPTFALSAENVEFTVVDTPQHLQIDASTVVVKGLATGVTSWSSGATLYESGSGSATVDWDSTNSGALTIDFSNYYFNEFCTANGTYPYETVMIQYEATVLSAALTGTDGNPNDVVLTYGHDGDSNTATSKSIVYTYKAVLTKYAESTSSQLYGAGFTITDVDNNVLRFIDNNDGTYTVYDGTSSISGTPVDRIYTSTDGTLTIYGLDANEQYRIDEVEAPSGYTLNTNYLTFTINGTTGTINSITSVEYDSQSQPVTGNTSWTADYNSTGNYLTLSLTDTKLAAMPAAGGVGIIVFTVLGVCLMIVAVFLLTSKDSKKKQAQ